MSHFKILQTKRIVGVVLATQITLFDTGWCYLLKCACCMFNFSKLTICTTLLYSRKDCEREKNYVMKNVLSYNN